MKKALLLLPLLLLPLRLSAQTCTQTYTLRSETCPAGAATCNTKDAALNVAEFDDNIENSILICQELDTHEAAFDDHSARHESAGADILAITSDMIAAGILLSSDHDLTENYVWTGDHDFGGGGLEVENSATPPSCTVGQIFVDTDATSGQQLMVCESGTFVKVGDGAGGGSAITLDLGDDGGDDSVDLTEIATTGDTNNVFTESAADKLLIAVGSNWPQADLADDLACTGCVAAADIATGGVATLELLDDTVGINDVDNSATLAGNPAWPGDSVWLGTTGILFEGASGNAAEGLLTSADITTTDKTWTLPDTSGTVALEGGNVATATALAANGANCSTGEIPLGVDASGAAESCYEPAEADISDLAHTATAITDGLIIEADLDEDSGTPTDEDVLTYDSTGTNFNWVAQSTLAAGTAAALAANGSNCAAGEIALGVDAAGAVEGCYEPAEADISDLDHLTEAEARTGLIENGSAEMTGETLGTACTENQILKANASGGLDCAADATGAGGSAITFDIGDDGGDDSVDVNEIATTGDTNTIFTEPSADKILIALGNNWPTADAADALSANGSNCSAGEIALGVDASGAVEGCYEPAEADISDLDHTATAITDGLIIEADLSEDSGTPTDEDVLTYDSTGTNFNWVAQSGLAAGTAAALAANGGNCAAGEIALGVDAAGAVEGCYEPAEADISDLSHTTDTGPSPDCSGTTTYQDGEGGCDDISGVYEGLLVNSAGLAAALSDETGTGVSVFGTSPTIATPTVSGKITRNTAAVDDDSCVGEQGLWWYDDTDSQFEFCNLNSGTPAAIATTSGDVTDVFDCASGDCNAVIVEDGETFDVAVGGRVEATEVVEAIDNDSGATLFECTAVYISGFDIPSDLPEASIADSDGGLMPALGLVMSDIANGSTGLIVASGALENIDTVTGEGWSVGDDLYVNTSGTSADTDCGNTLTNVKPTGTALIQKVGEVGRVHGTNGEILIFGSGRTNDVPNIPSTQFWVGNASAVATAVAMSADATMDNAGAVTVADDSHAHTTSTLTLNLDEVGDPGAATALTFGSGETFKLTFGSASEFLHLEQTAAATSSCLRLENDGDYQWDVCSLGDALEDNRFTIIDVVSGNRAFSIAPGADDDTFCIQDDGSASVGGCAAEHQFRVNGDIALNATGIAGFYNDVLDAEAKVEIEYDGDIVFEGTQDDFEGTLAVTDPTADRTYTVPDATGEFSLLGQTIDLTAEVTGTLPVASGGTGATTLTSGGLLLGNGTSTVAALGVATNGQVPIGDGLGAPQLATITGTANEITVTNGSASITLDIPTSPTLDGSNFTGIAAGAYDAASIDSDDLAAANKTKDHCITIADPATDDEWYTVWRAPAAITITEIYCEMTGGTSVAMDFEVDDGTPTGVNGSDITCDASETDSSLAGDTTMADGDRLDLDFGTVTGSVTQASFCFEYTID